MMRIAAAQVVMLYLCFILYILYFILYTQVVMLYLTSVTLAITLALGPLLGAEAFRCPAGAALWTLLCSAGGYGNQLLSALSIV